MADQPTPEKKAPIIPGATQPVATPTAQTNAQTEAEQFGPGLQKAQWRRANGEMIDVELYPETTGKPDAAQLKNTKGQTRQYRKVRFRMMENGKFTGKYREELVAVDELEIAAKDPTAVLTDADTNHPDPQETPSADVDAAGEESHATISLDDAPDATPEQDQRINYIDNDLGDITKAALKNGKAKNAQPLNAKALPVLNAIFPGIGLHPAFKKTIDQCIADINLENRELILDKKIKKLENIEDWKAFCAQYPQYDDKYQEALLNALPIFSTATRKAKGLGCEQFKVSGQKLIFIAANKTEYHVTPNGAYVKKMNHKFEAADAWNLSAALITAHSGSVKPGEALNVMVTAKGLGSFIPGRAQKIRAMSMLGYAQHAMDAGIPLNLTYQDKFGQTIQVNHLSRKLLGDDAITQMTTLGMNVDKVIDWYNNRFEVGAEITNTAATPAPETAANTNTVQSPEGIQPLAAMPHQDIVKDIAANEADRVNKDTKSLQATLMAAYDVLKPKTMGENASMDAAGVKQTLSKVTKDPEQLNTLFTVEEIVKIQTGKDVHHKDLLADKDMADEYKAALPEQDVITDALTRQNPKLDAVTEAAMLLKTAAALKEIETNPGKRDVDPDPVATDSRYPTVNEAAKALNTAYADIGKRNLTAAEKTNVEQARDAALTHAIKLLDTNGYDKAARKFETLFTKDVPTVESTVKKTTFKRSAAPTTPPQSKSAPRSGPAPRVG